MTKTIPHNLSAESIIPLLSLKAGRAVKLGQHSNGVIHYELLADAGRQSLLLRLTRNEGGGNFSPELVPFARVQAIVSGLPSDSPVASRVFRTCFRGRSQNNAGFCCCLLRAEGLLAPIEGKRYQHRVTGDWSAWAERILALPGSSIELPGSQAEDALPQDTPVPVPGRRGRHKAQRREEAEDDCLA